MSRWQSLIDSAKSSYDLVIVDCHPAGSFFTKSAIRTSDFVVVPVADDGYAAIGVGLMRTFLSTWAPAMEKAKYAIIFNHVRRYWNASVEQSIRTNPRYAQHCIGSPLRHSSIIAAVADRRKIGYESGRPHSSTIQKNIGDITLELRQVLLTEKVIKADQWPLKT